MKINIKGHELEIDDKFLNDYEETLCERLENNVERYIRTAFHQPDIEVAFATIPFYKLYYAILSAAYEELDLYKGEI